MFTGGRVGDNTLDLKCVILHCSVHYSSKALSRVDVEINERTNLSEWKPIGILGERVCP